jgi:hypothetical protein
MGFIGPVYILHGTIYFHHQGINDLGHPSFWREIVRHVFHRLDAETMRELMQACYGCDRGRLTKGEDGLLRLFGTPDCEPHKRLLLDLFGFRSRRGIVVNFADEHYRTLRGDVSLVKDALKFEGIVKPKKTAVVQYVEGGLFVQKR